MSASVPANEIHEARDEIREVSKEAGRSELTMAMAGMHDLLDDLAIGFASRMAN